MALPNSTIDVEKRGLGGVTVANENVHAVIGCSTSGPLLTPRLVNSRSLRSTFGAGIGVAATQIATEGLDAQYVFVRVPSTPRPASVTLDLDAFTGDAGVTVTVDDATTGSDVRIKFTTSAIVGVAGGIYEVSTDGGETYGSGVALGTGNTIEVLGVEIELEMGKEVDGTIGILMIPASESIFNFDTSAVTGTAAMLISGTPIDAYDGICEVTVGGNPGYDGIRLRYSLDGGYRFAPEKRLGTSLEFSPEDQTGVSSGVTITFDPVDEGDLVAFVADAIAEFLDHTGDTGAWHGGVADPAVYTIATPVDLATGISAFNQLLAAAKLHIMSLASSIHGAADTTTKTLLDAISAPTTMLGLRDAIIAFVAAFYGNGSTTNSGHTLRTASSVHAAEDNTNLITVDEPELSVLNAGDRILFRTTAPEPQASDVALAMQAIEESIYAVDYDFIHVVGEASPAFASTVSDKLDDFEGIATYTCGILSRRDRACGFTYDPVTGPDYPGETLADWETRVVEAYAAFSGERVATGGGMRRTLNPVTLWTQRRPVAWTAVNRLLTRPVQEELGRKGAGQVAALTSIVNQQNDYVEYNARLGGDLYKRCIVLRDFKDADGVYFALGSTCAPEGSDFSLVTYIRVMNFATRLFQKVGQEQIGNGLLLETTGPRRGKIRESDARKVDREIKSAIETKVSPTKGTASGLSVRVSRDDNLIPTAGGDPPVMTADVEIQPLGYVGGFRGRIRFARTLTQ